MPGWLNIVVAVAAGLAAAWLGLVVALLLARPRGGVLSEAMRLLPDVLVLLKRLATDPALPRGVRVRLWLLLAYLALPFDLVPDFIPILGWADDVILAVVVLRSVVRRAGPAAIRRHWPGTVEGLGALARATGVALVERR
jgi:uncharacterized membrane protein YkvA (DUF1232 family)